MFSYCVCGDVRYILARCATGWLQFSAWTPYTDAATASAPAKLRASSCLQRHARVMEEFISYPNDHERLLDSVLVLFSVHGFEEAEMRKMHVV